MVIRRKSQLSDYERIHIARGDGSGLTYCGAWEGAVDCMGRLALPDGPVCRECREKARTKPEEPGT